MVGVAGFQFDADGTAVDFGAGVDALVVDGNDVAAGLGDDGADAGELSGLVGEVDGEGVVASAFGESAGDDAAECVDVDVAAADEADNFLALDGHLVVHNGGHGNGAGALGHELLLLGKGEDGGGYLLVADSHDLVDVLVAHLEGVDTRLLDGYAVGYGADLAEAGDVSFLKGCGHGGSA